MKSNFINNNGAILHNTKKNLKTKVESQIENLKQQEQEIINELDSWETKSKKTNDYLTSLSEIERFGTKFLTEAIAVEKDKENSDTYRLEYLIRDKVEFAFKFETGSKVFSQLVGQKTESQVSYLKSQLRDIQSQLCHQERLFARIEIRRQGRTLLECKSGYRLGCPGVYQCANCQVNYSANNNQVVEMRSIPGGQINK